MDTHSMFDMIDQLKAQGIAVTDPRSVLRTVTYDKAEISRELRVPMRDKTPRAITPHERREMNAQGVYQFTDARAAYRCAKMESVRKLPGDAVDKAGKLVLPRFATVALDPERGDWWVYRDGYHPKAGADRFIFRAGKGSKLRHQEGTDQWFQYSVTYRKSTDNIDIYHDVVVWGRDANEAEHRVRTTADDGKRLQPDDIRTDIDIVEVMTPDAETFAPDPMLECMMDEDYLNTLFTE